jgi:hypothetical protein
MFLSAIFFFFSISLGALTIDDIRRRRHFAPSKLVSQLSTDGDENGMGVKEVEHPDGRREKVYFSVSGPQEDKAREEEKGKTESAWEMLRNIVIDKSTP